jgi:hypothetical protein
MGEDTSTKTAIGFDGPPKQTENGNDDEDEDDWRGEQMGTGQIPWGTGQILLRA